MTEGQIKNTFRYHSPNPEMVQTHEKIRALMTATVLTVAEMLPVSRERSTFITKMQEAQMMANAAVAIHGLPLINPNDPTKHPVGI